MAKSLNRKNIFLYLAWLIAVLSMVGSLFFSELMKLPPCSLCWYQRIFMYPLVFVLWVGFATKDINVYKYSLPMALIGWLIAGFHNLLYYKIISQSLSPCSAGVSCSERQLDIWGFISIPLLSLVAFSIIILLILKHTKQRGDGHE